MAKIIVSGFKTVMDSSNPFNRDVFHYLTRIKDGNSADLIKQIQAADTKDDRNKLKRNLPGVCFSGTFTNRSAAGLVQHSGLLVLDFDGLKTKKATNELKSSLSEFPFVFAAFVSPSGLGVKALVKIPREPEKHKNYFKAVKAEINSEYLDDSGKDVSRFCYESHDPKIYINPDCETFLKFEEDDIEEIGHTRELVTVPQQNEMIIIQNLLTWFDNKFGANQGSRNTNLFKLAMAFNDFGINEHTALTFLLQYQEKDFNASEITTLCKSAYKKGRNTFGTKFFEDRQLEVKIEKKIRTGKKPTDVKKWLASENITLENPDETIDRVKTKMENQDFWIYKSNGSVKISPNRFKFWLEQNNFLKYFPQPDAPGFQYIKKDQNLIEESDENRIKDFTLKSLMERTDVGFAPFDYFSENTKYFSPNFLSMLDSAEIKVKSDTKDSCFLYFKNCAVEVTKDGIKEIDFLDLDGYVWRNQIIGRDYKPTDHHESVFRSFVWYIAGEDEKRYNTFKSVIGYLLHSFKTSANNKAIIFNDETISDNPNGGSGKGLFWNALSKMKKVTMIDGKTFTFAKSFPYQTVSTDTQILVFDDVRKNFSFESLFSVITEGLTIEYKGKDAIKIPVEKSPKILITTNYTVGGMGGSFERRKFEVEMSSHFGAHHTPLEQFGHLFFDDWDSKEWARFDQYMINCVQYYLEHGLVNNEFNNLRLRKLITSTCPEFYEWTLDKKDMPFPFGIRNDKKKVYEQFLNEYPDTKKWLTQRKFTGFLEKFAKFHGYTFDQNRTASKRWFEIIDPKDTTIKQQPTEDKFEDDTDELPF